VSELAALHEAIDKAGGTRLRRDPRSPAEVLHGVPALQSASLDLGEAADLLRLMAEALLEAKVPRKVQQECRALLAQDARALVQQVAARREPPQSFAAFLAWKAIARTVRAAEGARGAMCPTCGAPPAMARLSENARTLCCGLCSTEWRYARVGCPYCGSEEPASILEPLEEPAFRIDVCRGCNAYLKTFLGAADPNALSDWSTLHLDAACAGRGLRRGGPSLYDL